MIAIDEKLLQLNTIHLKQLKPEHLEGLVGAAKEPCIWINQRMAYHQPTTFKECWFNKALDEMQKQKRYVFVVFLNDIIIGSSSYYDIDYNHQKMKMGYTWYHPKYWGQGINPTVKYLLLRYAFENLKFNRVSFSVDSDNTQSRRALEKLQISFEGILKSDMLRPDGTHRDSAVYAVTAKDWLIIKEHIAQRYLVNRLK